MVMPVPALEKLSVLGFGPSDPSSTLLSRKPAHKSASDSFPDVGVFSEKNSVLKDGVLGVLWKGDDGSRSVLFDAPGLASPACSFCSSVQLR